jgi:ferric-dicitrate binding protein FerR (iron transport regulator)
MNKRYLISLLHKYLKGNVTDEERKFVEDYYNVFSAEKDVIGVMSEDELLALENEMNRNIIRDGYEDLVHHAKVKRLANYRKLAAAAAVVVFISAAALYFFNNGPAKETGTQPLAVQAKSNRVFFLPDGSSVILSPGGKLNYPSSFDGMDKREVYLEGEAFFDIQHNARRPFIVHTGKLVTTVLGTAFNVRAMPGETDITVTVKRGKVKVSDEQNTLGIIEPDQQITFNKKEITAAIKVVEADNYIEWKEENLLFDNLTIAEAAKLLEEKFKTQIVINDQSIGSQRFSASFPKDETLEDAIKIICMFNRVTYRFSDDGTKIFIENE